MSDYTKTVDFAAKDALATGDANKLAKGTEVGTEFDNIETAIATKANKLTSPTTDNLLKQDANGDLTDATSIKDDGADVTIATGRGLKITDNSELYIGGAQVTATAADLNRIVDTYGMVLLETATPSAASTVDFETGIDSTYDSYLIDFTKLTVSNDGAQLYLRVGTGATPTYQTGTVYGNSGTDKISLSPSGIGSDVGEHFFGQVWAYNPADTAVRTGFRIEVQYFINTGAGAIRTAASDYSSVTAVTAFRIYPDVGSVSGTVNLYGRKK